MLAAAQGPGALAEALGEGWEQIQDPVEDFGAADAFFAPVVTRFDTYEVPLNEAAAAYRNAVMSWPAMGLRC